MNRTSLRNNLMVAQLNISKWSAKTYDKNATKTVEAAYHTQKNVGRFQKEIIDSAELKEIDKICAWMRGIHCENTLPWGDNGDRLLPISNYSNYKAQMDEHISQFNNEVAKFLAKYPELKKNARERLGGLFDPKNYPSDVSDKFAIRINYFPVPIAEDIRLDLPSPEIRSIQENVTETVNARLEDAIKDIWMRMEIVLDKMIERLSDPDNKFKNSLVDNIAAIIKIAPKLNVFNDPNLTEICKKMEELLVDPNGLRFDPKLRKLIVEKASQISNDVKSFAASGSRYIEL